MVIVLNKIKTYFSKPQNIILLLFGIVLTFTTVAPIVAIVEDTFKIHPGTIDAHLTGKAGGYSVANYVDLFTSKLARTNLWTPLLNTVLLAVFTCLISILFGGLFAFLITRTNLKCKKYLSSIFIFPYIMPQWTLALWYGRTCCVQLPEPPTDCFGIPLWNCFSEVVVSGTVPQRGSVGIALCPLRLHPDRRYLP